LACVSGTIFGRDVVPEVCNTSAMSSGRASPRTDARCRRWIRMQFGYIDAHPRGDRARRRVQPRGNDQQPGLQILQVEREVVFAISRVQRGTTAGRSGCEERRRHLGAVGQHDGNRVIRAQAAVTQLLPDPAHEATELAKAERRATGREDCGIPGEGCGMLVEQGVQDLRVFVHRLASTQSRPG
jgi:hypothetical protein